jgi:multidrug efflux pump subunit AcrB
MYRGLAAVNVAGIIFSMVFSVVLLPSLMRLLHRERSTSGVASGAADANLQPV